jgi:hypothetical protein
VRDGYLDTSLFLLYFPTSRHLGEILTEKLQNCRTFQRRTNVGFMLLKPLVQLLTVFEELERFSRWVVAKGCADMICPIFFPDLKKKVGCYTENDKKQDGLLGEGRTKDGAIGIESDKRF